MRLSILIFLLASIAYSQAPTVERGVSHELAKWRAERYSDVRYKLDLTLEKMSPVLKGTMEIRLRLEGETGRKGEGESVGPIILDWRKLKGFEDRSTVSNVSINGRVRRVAADGFEESNEHLIFREGVVAGENVIKLDFTSPILPSGSAITRYVDKEDGSEYIYSLFVPSDASTAFPVFDQPDLKARFTLSVTAPPDWIAVGNTRASKWANADVSGGIAGPNPSNGFVFAETKPISTYVFAFAAGPWERVAAPGAAAGRGRQESEPGAVATGAFDVGSKEPQTATNKIPLATASGSNSYRQQSSFESSIYVRKSQLEKFKPHAAEVFRLNREGIKFLEEYFAYKFPFPKYDLVLIPEFPFGGMEHAGATFLRESSVIFPSEPTANDHISRANLIFHEAAHQWFGDTVTMRWFDDLWLKEGFAEFMAYKTLEKVMPQYNAWKVFYERNKQAAYLTDSTKGTTPIYQEIKNLSAAKSAYGNIVYRKAPSFLKQAEFYIGADKFQTAVRAFLKKHEFANAGWQHLVAEFETAAGKKLTNFAETWVKRPGMPILRVASKVDGCVETISVSQQDSLSGRLFWEMRISPRIVFGGRGKTRTYTKDVVIDNSTQILDSQNICNALEMPVAIFPNYQDYGYGIFLLDDKSRNYVLKNIQNEKDDFLRSMMWGALWDSVREGELDPKEYVELVIATVGKSDAFTREGSSSQALTPKGVTPTEDESTVQTLLNRVSTAMTYYIDDEQKDAIAPRLEAMLIEKMRTAPTLGQRITFYRAFLNVASTGKARQVLKEMLRQKSEPGAVATGAVSGSKRVSQGVNTESPLATASGTDSGIDLPLKTKDRFDIVTRLLILNDPDAPRLLADLERSETSDEAKRYAYAARAGISTKENKAKYWTDFTANKEISESWIEAAFGPFNSVLHADLTLPYLERALRELPNHKRSRKIFFVNGWLAAFIGGQRSEEALAIVNKFLADNPNLDRDLRLKILENVDVIERAVKIRKKYPKD